MKNKSIINKSEPQFICDFYGEKMYAQFFAKKDNFIVAPDDYEYMLPKKPFKKNNYAGLYDDIFDRMKMRTIEYAESLPKRGNEMKKYRLEMIDFMKELQSPECKESFLKKIAIPFLRFEEIRPIVKKFIDNYLKKHPQFKYIRIFTLSN